MRDSISKSQKTWMFFLASLFGAQFVIMGIFMKLPFQPANRDWTVWSEPIEIQAAYWAACVGAALVQMVFGAWVGALVTLAWRSPPGRRLFRMLTGGVAMSLVGYLGGGIGLMLFNVNQTGVFFFPIMVGLGFVATGIGMLLGLWFERKCDQLAAAKMPMDDAAASHS